MTTYFHQEKPHHDSRWAEALDCLTSGDGEGAVFRYRSLAVDGCGPALAQLGRIYENGLGTLVPNHEGAVKWYRRSVELLDDIDSHLSLAKIYLQSKTLDVDQSLALYHLELLNDNNVSGAAFAIGLMHQNGVAVSQNIDSAKEYFLRAVELGHIEAKLHLARIEFEANPLRSFLPMIRAFIKFRRLQKSNPLDPRLGIQTSIEDTITIPK